MAHETLDRLGDQLSALLNDMDAAIRDKFRDSPRQKGRSRREETPRHRKRRSGVVMAALRRFLRSWT